MKDRNDKLKKKLLIFTSTFPRWKNDVNPPFVYELSKRLTNKFEISVLTPHYPGSKQTEKMDEMNIFRFRYFLEKFEKLAGGHGILPTLKKNKLYYLLIPFFLTAEYFSLKKIIKKVNPDIIHAHWILPQGFIASLIKRKYKIPLVVTTHGGDIFGMQNKIFTSLKKYTLRTANITTVVSNPIKKFIHENINPDLEIKIMPMGVDSNSFSPNKKDNSLKIKHKINGPFLIFVGRLAEKKGVEYLIKAMPKIIKHDNSTKLMIIGDGNLKNKLIKLTKNLHLNKNIIFTGAIINNDLPKYYAMADIFIGPSIQAKGGDTEGLGLTFIEAGFSGCIPIGSNIGGITDVIQDKITGYLIEQKNPESISKTVIKILDDKTKMTEMKSSIRNKLKNKFDWKIVSENYAKILNQ